MTPIKVRNIHTALMPGLYEDVVESSRFPPYRTNLIIYYCCAACKFR